METQKALSNVNRVWKIFFSFVPQCLSFKPPFARSRAPTSEAGYTIFLVLVLISLIGILFSVVNQETNLVNLTTSREIHRVQARLLAESGITRAEYFLSGGDGHTILWESDGCDEPVESFGAIHLECRRFGLFAKLISQGTRIRTTNTITAIAGRTIPESFRPVLTLSGKVGGLALMPASRIKGTVVLSHGRVCQGESSREVKDKNLIVTIKESPALPFDSSQAISVVKQLENEFKEACSLKTVVTGSVTLSTEKDPLVNGSTLVVSGDCRIDKGDYGEKTVFAGGTILLTGAARCTVCKFYAKRIVIDGGLSDKCVFFSKETMNIKGGSYNSQAFCTDSLLTSKKVTFGPMSLLMQLREGAADSTVAVSFAPNTIIRGTIICCSDSIARTHAKGTSVIFGKGCVLNGICMTDGDIDINGVTVYGRLWARSIVTSDGKKAYVNYCFDTHIEEPRVEMVFPLIGISPASLIIEKISDQYTR